MVEGRPRTPLLQKAGERGFVFFDFSERTKWQIAAKLDSQQSHRRPRDPTNNHTKQLLRKMVIFRKIYFRNRSDSGLKTHSVLPSLVQTARRQNINLRQLLQILFTSDTSTSLAALYNNLS